MLLSRMVLLLSVAMASSIVAPGLAAAADAAGGPNQAPVEVRSTNRPRPVAGSDGHAHVAYELHVTNFYEGTGPLRLQRVVISAGSSAEPLVDLRGPDIRSLLAPSANEAPPGDVTIEGGKRVTLFVWLQLPHGASPASLRHQLDFLTQDGKLQRANQVQVEVDRARPIAIAAPLRGHWLANEGPGNSASHHWSGVTAIAGDSVRLGEVIAQVGQTGSAGAPHLHIHLSDSARFENSEGLPFVIDKFAVRGKLRIDQTFGGSALGALERATSHRMEMPLDGDVVDFPGSD